MNGKQRPGPAQGCGCAIGCIILGLWIAYYAISFTQQGKFAIKDGQSREVMMANAQAALHALTSRTEPEKTVIATITTLDLVGNEMRIQVVEKPKTPDQQEYIYKNADAHACEWTERIAQVAPRNVTVSLTLLDKTGVVLSKARRPPGTWYFTRAKPEKP